MLDLKALWPSIKIAPFLSKLDEGLERTAWDEVYWRTVRQRAKELNSDGCTGVLNIFVWTCLEHDIHFRTHETLGNIPLSFEEANYIFYVRIKQTKYSWNPLTWLKYPIAAIRYWAVSKFGYEAWRNYGGQRNSHTVR